MTRTERLAISFIIASSALSLASSLAVLLALSREQSAAEGEEEASGSRGRNRVWDLASRVAGVALRAHGPPTECA